MIDKNLVIAAVESAIEGTDIFLVEASVSPADDIIVEIDSPTGLDIDTCVNISRKIEEHLDRDVEDFSLEVGSAGLTAPFKVRGQWLKNIGNEIELITCDGRKMHGTLVDVTDDNRFTIEVPTKVRPEGKKRPVTVMQPVEMAIDQVKTASYMLKFK